MKSRDVFLSGLSAGLSPAQEVTRCFKVARLITGPAVACAAPVIVAEFRKPNTSSARGMHARESARNDASLMPGRLEEGNLRNASCIKRPRERGGSGERGNPH